MPKRLGILSLALLLLAWPAARSSAFLIRVVSGTTITQAITAVALSGSNYTSGASTGTVIGAISVTMLPSSPTFSGTLSLSGAAAADFSLSSTTLPANLTTNSSTATCSTTTTYNINIVAMQGGVNGSPFTQAETITCNPNQTVSAIALNFVPQGNYTSGSGAITNYDLYFTGGCASGTQIGSLVATASGGPYAGSWTLTGTNASSFTVTGSNPGALKCNGTVAAGSYSFNAVAGTNSFSQAITAYAGQTYYMAASGCNDSNAGTSSGSPWCSIDHTLNCGDFIQLASGSYSATNFEVAGTTTCSGNDNVFWIKGAANFGSSVSSSSVWAISGQESYIGVQGMVLSGATSGCFKPANSTEAFIVHHVAAGNNVIENCVGSGIQMGSWNGTTNGNDYEVIIGNLLYKNASSTSLCFSGISFAGDSNEDTNAGTHSYLAFNVSWANLNGAGCAGGTATTDGEGIIIDSLYVNDYTGQIVLEDNLLIGNGGAGLEIYQPVAASGAPLVVARYNTLYDNDTDTHRNGTLNWDLEMYGPSANSSVVFTAQNNLVDEASATNPGNSSPIYALGYVSGETSSLVDGNWLFGLGSPHQNIINFGYNPSGGTLYTCNSGTTTNPGSGSSNTSSCSANTLSTSAAFTSATIPGAPSCGSSADTLACMATAISNFKPTASGAGSYGAVNASGTLGNNATACDTFNSTAFILNVERALPSDMDKCG